jgi:antitoxin component of MazEF toxin-antitoxin module
MMTQRIHRIGKSLVIIIPKEVAERQNLHEGDFVSVEICKLHLEPEMSPEVRAAFEQSWQDHEADLRYLAER